MDPLRPLGLVVLLLAAAAAGEPGFNEFPIAMSADVRPVDGGGTIIQVNHRDRIDRTTGNKPAPSRLRAYLPPGPEPLTGILYDVGETYPPDNTALQQVARVRRWAIVGTLMRYQRGTELFDAALGEVAAKGKRPELTRLPIVPWAFSRNGGRAWTFAEETGGRVAGIVLGGNPGLPSGARERMSASRAAILAATPILTVVGSRDPFVDYNKGEARFWHVQHYPVIRSWQAPWGMALLWGGGHDWSYGHPLLVAFTDLAIRRRVAGRTGPAFAEGWLVQARWTKDWIEPWPAAGPVSGFAGDAARTVWLPGPELVDLWRGANVATPEVTVAVAGTPAAPQLTATVPAGTVAVEYRHLDALLVRAGAAPFAAAAPALAKGLHHVTAVAVLGDGSRRAARPITVVDGVALDWAAGVAAERAAAKPEQVIRLEPELRRALLDQRAGRPVEAARAAALTAALTKALEAEHVEQRQAAQALLGKGK